jgi:CubicO group peptidase (beta-lactamase class C family)
MAMRIRYALLALLSLLTQPLAAQSPHELNPNVPLTPKPHVAAPVHSTVAPVPPATLSKADVDAWLDGFLPYALDQGDIAGAVVVVVKDGQVLTERGFGYADMKTRRRVDPVTTTFRPGSISKLFTWTAVMQQVQAGKLNLDRDINDYLDFKIPAAFGKPITLRNLMTHTGGFEETARNLLVFDPKQNRPLGEILKRWTPGRIYAPGTMPAYSNYGCALAGYIVQRVSGERFEDYVQHHIFAPLNMTHSTFEQPLPAGWSANAAVQYQQASQDAKGFEIIGLSPAGALSASGDDMARFMIAHLGSGPPLLSAQTEALMRAPANTPIPGLPPMALGFYHEDRNGLTIIGHGGDTQFMHSDLHLFLDKGVGLFMSFNSAGKAGSAHVVRQALFDNFVDRYFPSSAAALPTVATAHAHGAAMAGHYISSRAAQRTLMRAFIMLGGTSVALNPDDTITVAALTNPAGVPKKWREIGPWLWQEVGGTDRLGARVQDGHVQYFAPSGFAPIIEFVPAPASMNMGWIGPVAGIAFAILLLTALAWPIVAITRRRYKYDAGLTGRPLQLYRATRATAWLLLVFWVGWLLLVSKMGADVSALDGRLDGWMRLMQIVLLVAIVGTVLAIWNAVTVWQRPGRHRFATVCSILVALAAVFLIWLAMDARLLTASLNF